MRKNISIVLKFLDNVKLQSKSKSDEVDGLEYVLEAELYRSDGQKQYHVRQRKF